MEKDKQKLINLFKLSLSIFSSIGTTPIMVDNPAKNDNSSEGKKHI